MFLKPKSTTNNPPALLYKRFTQIEQSFTRFSADITDGYITQIVFAGYRAFMIDADKYSFFNEYIDGKPLPKAGETIEVYTTDSPDVPVSATVIRWNTAISDSSGIVTDESPIPKKTATYADNKGIFKIGDTLYSVGIPAEVFVNNETQRQESPQLLSELFSNVAKYQTNKYYFAGSFDYMIKGSSDSATTQFSTGLISPLRTMTIRTFSDYPEITEEDLVVVNGALYSIESIEVSRKQLPKPFNIYFLTLNSIL